MDSPQEVFSSSPRFRELFQSSLRLLEELFEFSAAQLWEIPAPGGRPLLRAKAGKSKALEASSLNDQAMARDLFERVSEGPCYMPWVAEEQELSCCKALAAQDITSLVALPIGVPGNPWALLILYSENPLELDRRQRGFMEAVAAQASLALRNTQCCFQLKARCQEIRKSTRRWNILARYLRLATPGGGPELVASVLAEAAESLWGATIVLIWMLDETSGALQLVGTFGSQRERAERLIQVDEPFAKKLLRGGRLLMVRNLAREPLWRNRELTEVLGLRAMLGAPLVIEGRPVGAMMLLSPSPGKITSGDKPLLEVFALQMIVSWELWWALKGLEESQGRLIHAERYETLAELVMGETHDFNNALGLILGNAHMLRSKLASTEEALKALDVIEQAVADATDRVRRLQGLRSRIAEGPRVDPVDLNNVAEEVLQMMRVKFKEALGEGTPIEVKKDLRPTLPALADPALLKEALINVVTNSLQAMPNGGKITLRTWEGPKAVHLSVSDTGFDLSSGSKAGQFGPAPSVARADSYGTALGIVTACNLIKTQRGEVVVHHEEDLGTTVTISLPKATQEEQGSLDKEACKPKAPIPLRSS